LRFFCFNVYCIQRRNCFFSDLQPCSPFSSESVIHTHGVPAHKPVTRAVHLSAPPPDFLMEATLAAAAASHPHVVSRLTSDEFACSFPRVASRVYTVRCCLPTCAATPTSRNYFRCQASAFSGRKSGYHYRSSFCRVCKMPSMTFVTRHDSSRYTRSVALGNSTRGRSMRRTFQFFSSMTISRSGMRSIT
jgi:hypothetical protein